MRRQKETKEPKLTDAERHARFLKMARELDASENEEDFSAAFDSITTSQKELPEEG